MVIVKLTVMEMAYQTLKLVHSLLLHIAMYVRTYSMYIYLHLCYLLLDEYVCFMTDLNIYICTCTCVVCMSNLLNAVSLK